MLQIPFTSWYSIKVFTVQRRVLDVKKELFRKKISAQNHTRMLMCNNGPKAIINGRRQKKSTETRFKFATCSCISQHQQHWLRSQKGLGACLLFSLYMNVLNLLFKFRCCLVKCCPDKLPKILSLGCCNVFDCFPLFFEKSRAMP